MCRQNGISKIFSTQKALCKNYLRGTSRSASHKADIAALKEITALLDKNNLLYWVDCGTLLGVYRYGGIIPWDDDIDIAIFNHDYFAIKHLLRQLNPKKYQVQDWSCYTKPHTFLKILIKESNTLIDIYHYNIDFEKKEIQYIFSYEHSSIPDKWKEEEMRMLKPIAFDNFFPLKKGQFEDFTVWTPNNIESVLQGKYGDNLEPTMVWDQHTHSYRKDEKHPYWHR